MEQPLPYQFCVAVLGISWIVVYGLIIHHGFRDRVYGMPLVAVCGNLSWEFQFAFIRPYEAVQQTADAIWFVMNLFIAATVLRYGPRQFPGLPRSGFYALFGTGMLLAFTGMPLLARELGDMASIYTGFGDTLMMSALFISMAIGRRSLAGQSLAIAYTKWLGTAVGSVAYYFFDEDHAGNALIGYAGIAIFVLDGIYAAVLHWLKSTGRSPQRHSEV
ncbi:transmembrane-type terpene cyclase [Streptomyces sp. NPDC054796]